MVSFMIQQSVLVAKAEAVFRESLGGIKLSSNFLRFFFAAIF